MGTGFQRLGSLLCGFRAAAFQDSKPLPPRPPPPWTLKEHPDVDTSAQLRELGTQWKLCMRCALELRHLGTSTISMRLWKTGVFGLFGGIDRLIHARDLKDFGGVGG